MTILPKSYLVLIVLRTRTDKTAVSYIKVELYKPPLFNVCLFKRFLYKEVCRIASLHAACLPAVGVSPNNEFAIKLKKYKFPRDKPHLKQHNELLNLLQDYSITSQKKPTGYNPYGAQFSAQHNERETRSGRSQLLG